MEIKGQIEVLWKRCFGDTDHFIALYFSHCYTPETSRYLVRDGVVVSALQAITAPFVLCGKEVKMQYVSGVNTHPDYRRQGFAQQLLTETHQQMFADEVVIATLVPADIHMQHYYAAQGYASVFTDEHIAIGDEIVWERPADFAADKFGMARIIHAEKALTAYAAAHPDANLSLAVSDDTLPQNNGYYIIGKGVCHRTETAIAPCRSVNAAQLTALIFADAEATLILDLFRSEVTL